MAHSQVAIRTAKPDEYDEIGQLLVRVYAQLEGFPKQEEQPEYYATLANLHQFMAKPATTLLVAVSEAGKIVGAVAYIGDMQHYGSGGTATQEQNAAGFRLLVVDPSARGQGIGMLLARACINKAKKAGLTQVIIHSSTSMQTALALYKRLGFTRSEDLDFMQGAFPVLGFRLRLP